MLFNVHSHVNDFKNIVILNDSIDNEYKENFYSIGIHPWQANFIEENLLKVLEKGYSQKCLAIGEIGLDKLKGPSLDIQLNCFRSQLIIAESLDLPVIIHCVKSWNEIKNIYKEKRRSQKWVYHGFNKVSILEDVINTGFMISVGVSILSNVKLQEVVHLIPDDQLLLETDNSEVNIFDVYQKISEIKKISLRELEDIILHNFQNTFTRWSIG